jgi:transcriptional regulator with XRE-family HTH domain
MLPWTGQFFQAIRKAKGLKQKEIADKVKVERSSLSKFESSIAAISQDKIENIAKQLDINPRAITDPAVNAFRAKSFFKLTASGAISIPGGVPYSVLIMYLIMYTERLQFVLLAERDEILYVAAKDEQDSIFLLKKKDGFGKISDASSFINRSDEIAATQKKTETSQRVWAIDGELRGKLKSWEKLERADLVHVFEKRMMVLTEEEWQVVDALRRKESLDKVTRLVRNFYENGERHG